MLTILQRILFILVVIASPVYADDVDVFRKIFGEEDKVVVPLTNVRSEEVIREIKRDNNLSAMMDMFQQELPIPIEDSFGVILKDLESVPVNERMFTRYLDMSAVFPNERLRTYIVTSVALNSLSWNQSITLPVIVNCEGKRLIRFNMSWYSNDLKDLKRWFDAWERISSFDGYYLEPWVRSEDAAQLRTMTSSAGAILRADWFCFYSMQEDDLSTSEVEGFYSSILGLPNSEKELLSLLKVRLDDVAEVGADRRGLVIDSGQDSDAHPVAKNNRKVNRAPTILVPHGGYFYYTQDYINSRGKRNVLNDPLDDDKDGGEYIWSLPNRLQGYYLTAKDAKKVHGKSVVNFKQISEVPIGIASSLFSHHRVKYNTCLHCHTYGINQYKDVFQETLLRLSEPAGVVALTESKHDAIKKAQQLFAADMKGYVRADQINYTMAVQQASGVSPEQLTSMWFDVFETYEAPLTPKRAAWEYGTNNLEEYLADKVVSSTQGSLLLLVKGEENDRLIRRDTFEEEYKNGKLIQQVKQNITPNNGVPVSMQVPVAVTLTQNVEVPIANTEWWIAHYPSAKKAKYVGAWPVGSTFSFSDVLKHIKDGSVDSDTYVWLRGSSKTWVKARVMFPELF